MQRLILLLVSLSLLAGAFACNNDAANTPTSYPNDSPTEAYKRLYAAVKSKDTEAIKKQLTKNSIELGAMGSQRYNKPIESAYENGLTATTFAASQPTIRDERIQDDMGAVEVWNSKDSRWEDTPFIFQDGAWKLAVGDLFAGNFKSPGKGLDLKEKEAANAMAPATPTVSNANAGPSVNAKSK